MDDGGYSIGELARRTGATVKAIRFYSDQGIVPPAGRNPAGHRRYGADAVARLELVRTLRDLGVGLPAIRRIVDREVPLAEVAAAHAEALAVQIRTLRQRRAVLTAVARRGAGPEEMDLMHRLATLSEEERRRLVGEFLDAAFAGLPADPGFAGVRRTLTPELPDDPTTEQVEAWVELAELSRDPDFRAVMNRMAGDYARDRGDDRTVRPHLAAVVRDQAAPAVAAGIDPEAPEADPVVAAVVAHYAGVTGRPGGPGLRRLILARLETAGDPRRDRYLRLLAVVNGWVAPDPLAPVLDWFVRALRARP